MKLKSIKIENFLSIKTIQLDLDNQGLVLLQGENLDNPSLNNNGSGKSSVFEAIVYALYGKTIRGIKGDDIVHNKVGKNTFIELVLEDDDGVIYVIHRYRRHCKYKNKSMIFKNNENVTPKSESDFDEYVTTLIQADFQTFISSLFYSSESFKFSTATDSDIKKVFDTMFQLDVLSKAQEIAKENIGSIQKTIDTNITKIQLLNSNLKILQTNLDNLTEKSKAFETEKTQKLKFYQESITVAADKLKVHQESSQVLQKCLNDLNESYNSLLSEVQQKTIALKSADNLKFEIQKGNLQIQSLNREIEFSEGLLANNKQSSDKHMSKIQSLMKNNEILHNKIADVLSKVGTPCPTCGKPLDETSLESAKKELQDKIQQNTSEIQDNFNQITKLKTENAKHYKDIDNIKKEIEGIQRAIKNAKTMIARVSDKANEKQNLENQLKSTYSEISSTKSQISSLDSEILGLQSTVNTFSKLAEELNLTMNPHTDVIHSTTNSINQLKREIDELVFNNAALVDQLTCFQFWEMAYSNKGIKSFILDNITPFLNQKLNKYLGILTSGNIEATFSTQTELKSGQFREKFSLSITNKDGGKNYVANSSGERKRIDLAITLALQDLISSRSSKKLNVVLFDEIFDTLDEKGIENVVSLLNEISQSKPTILVVSHNEIFKSYFQNVLTITKQNGFSILKQY